MWQSFRNNQLNCILPITRKCQHETIIKTRVGGLIWGTAVIDQDDNVYVGSTNKRFYCLNNQGRIMWKYRLTNTNDSLIDSAAALHPRGFVVIPGGDGLIHAVDMKTGKMIWRYDNTDNMKHKTGEVVNSYEGNIQIDENGMIYAGCDNDFMYCLDWQGKLQWKYKTNMMIWTCAAISQTTCYFGSLDFNLYAVDKFNGNLQAKVYTGSEIKSSPVLYDNHIFVGNTNGIALCFTLELNKVWHTDVGRNIYATPVIFDKTIIYTTLAGIVTALSLKDGHVVWTTQLFSNVCSSSVIINNVMFVGTNLCKLISMDPRNGNLLGCVSLNKVDQKRAINASLAVNKQGQIIVGSYDGHIYYVPCDIWKTQRDVSLTSIAELKVHKPIYLETYRNNAHIISIRLVVLGHPNAAVSYNSVTIKPKIPYTVETSADGKFINLLPIDWSYLNRTFTIKLKGRYYIQSENWLLDRLKYDVNVFEDTVTFDSPKTRNLSKLPRYMDIANMYLMQPQVLDTYIPAAFDAQGWRIVFLDSKNLAMVSCLPDIEDKFIVTATQIVYMTYEKYENVVKAISSGFEISAMGGTIPTKSFIAYMQIEDRNVKGEFFGLTNCLSIKGNGKSYKFSSDVINQIADVFLQMQSIGSFSGEITI